MKCALCPVACGVDRKRTIGYCGEKEDIRIAKYYLHTFEEPPISGEKGSGTVFFCGCSLKCEFCQNYALSRSQTGKVVTPSELADIFARLEEAGASNINLVTPTHFVPSIAKAFEIYRPKIPVVYNTHSYEPLETLKIADGFVDIYLADMKFFSPAISKRYTGKENYFEFASRAIEFMTDSKKIVFDDRGMMKSGVVVRHLVMPSCLDETRKIIGWFADKIGDRAYFSLMSQYTPFVKSEKHPELNRKITRGEYDRAFAALDSFGVKNFFIQQLGSADESFIPEWDF
ncbi:MAG: radical SAM protein [Clostridia bacterium]|nr:radical SAM protein [Clostridia bacterium]